jgi:hypothetical protein
MPAFMRAFSECRRECRLGSLEGQCHLVFRRGLHGRLACTVTLNGMSSPNTVALHDGKRFLLMKQEQSVSDWRRIHVVVNWFEELKTARAHALASGLYTTT